MGQRFTERLRCKLTDSETIRKGQELTKALSELSALEDEKKQHAADLSAAIKRKKSDGAALAYDLRSGTEERPVECYEVQRFDELLVDIIRSDTHEVVRTRAMQPEERQREFELESTRRRGRTREDDQESTH